MPADPLRYHVPSAALETTPDMTEPLAILADPRPETLADTPYEFLRQLGAPTEIRLAGQNPGPARAISALLHGNEPSSVVAVHRYLRSGRRPAVDISIFVTAVEAALVEPGFALRMLPGRRDLNRCFFPYRDDVDGRLAAAVLDRLRARRFEALVDLHNNTGRNPPYGIINRRGLERLKLVELFTDACCVLSDLRVGALTEAIVDELPSVAIECGHAADEHAHELAYRGIERFVTTPDLALSSDLHEPVAMFDRPLRVELRRGLSVAFASEPHQYAELTLRADVDTHNFRRLERGTVLGWLRAGAEWPLTARGSDGVDVSRQHFTVQSGALIHDSDLVPIMMTTNAQIAMVDCLCYLMRQRDWYQDLHSEANELQPDGAA